MNQDTEVSGLKAVIEHEQLRGRTAIRVQKCGYDLISTCKGAIRHIEVKATSKSHFTFRWLEQLEQNLAENDPDFFLYLVTDAKGPRPRVWEYDREKLRKQFLRVEHHHVYKFRKSDFQIKENPISNPPES